MTYIVEADRERRGSSRVRFQNDINTYTGNLTMTSSKTACETLKLFVVVSAQRNYCRCCIDCIDCILCYLQMIILLSDWREQINCGYLIVLCLLRQAKRNSLINSQEPVRDKLEPVVFFLNFSLYEPIPRARRAPQNLDFFPILSPEQKSSRRTEVWSLACTSFTGFLFSNLEMVKKWYGTVSPCKI